VGVWLSVTTLCGERRHSHLADDAPSIGNQYRQELFVSLSFYSESAAKARKKSFVGWPPRQVVAGPALGPHTAHAKKDA